MKSTLALAPALAAALLAAPCAALAQYAAPDCAALVVPYEKRAGIASPAFSLDMAAAGGGRLIYLGSHHTSDPADPAIGAIATAFEKAKPTIAFYEGPDRPIAATRDETIKSANESGFVRYLAKEAGIQVGRLEPSPMDEVGYLTTKFSAEQVQLFFLLRETARLRERKGMGEAELRAAIGQLIERAGKMGLMTQGITSVDLLEAAYARHWKTPEAWWQAPTSWFDPLKTSAETGGLFTNEVNKASSHFRNLHMVAVLSKAARDGHRVFAVVGRDHVPMQADALRCALE